MDLDRITQIKKMFEIVKSSSNPKAMIEAMAKSNPELNKVLLEFNSSSSSPKDLFYSKARELGMSDSQIDEFIKSLSNTISM